MNISIKKNERTKNIYNRQSRPPKPLNIIEKDICSITSNIEELSIKQNKSTKLLNNLDESSSNESSSNESSFNESSSNESSSNESSSNESSSDESSSDESSSNESFSNESSSNESSLEDRCFKCCSEGCDYVFRGIIKNTRRKCIKCKKFQFIKININPIVKPTKNIKNNLENKNETLQNYVKVSSKRKNNDNNINEVILKTKNLVINDNLKTSENIKINKNLEIEESPRKRIKIGDNDDWKYPLEKKPIFNYDFKIVDNIKTKYISIIPFVFSEKPSNCKYWDKHFNKDKILSKLSFNIHWDLFSFMFIFFNYGDNTYSSNINEFDKKDVDENDINVQLDSKLTLILRPVSYEIVKYLENETENNRFKYRIIKNLRFVTHFNSQINLYKDENIYDKNKSWILHLILNEKNIDSKKYINQKDIYFSNKNIKYKYTLLNLYQMLYLYFSRQITI
jgi:hypothetical protein